MKRDTFAMPPFVRKSTASPLPCSAMQPLRRSHQVLPCSVRLLAQRIDGNVLAHRFRFTVHHLVSERQDVGSSHHLARFDFLQRFTDLGRVPSVHRAAQRLFEIAVNQAKQREQLVFRCKGFKFFCGQSAVGNTSGHFVLHEEEPVCPAPTFLVLARKVGNWLLVAITLCMLQALELFLAQSFPPGCVVQEIPDPAQLFASCFQAADPPAVPRIPLTATAQVRMCGNSVAPAQAEAMARANFKHELQITRTVAT